MTTLTTLIIAARKSKGWNQKVVADKLGIKFSTYAKKEHDGEFSQEEQQQLTKLLSLKPSDLKQAKKNAGLTLNDSLHELTVRSFRNEAYLRVILKVLAASASKNEKQKDALLKEWDRLIEMEVQLLFDRE